MEGAPRLGDSSAQTERDESRALLELKEVSRSEKPLADFNLPANVNVALRANFAELCVVGDVTLAYTPASAKIEFFDNQDHTVSDVPEVVSTRNLEMNWLDHVRRGGGNQTSMTSDNRIHGNSYDFLNSTVDPLIIEKTRAKMGLSSDRKIPDGVEVYDERWIHEPAHVITTSFQDGRYQAFINKGTGDAVIFTTQNEQGTPLPPRMWNRFYINNARNWPDVSVTAYIPRALKENPSLREELKTFYFDNGIKTNYTLRSNPMDSVVRKMQALGEDRKFLVAKTNTALSFNTLEGTPSKYQQKASELVPNAERNLTYDEVTKTAYYCSSTSPQLLYAMDLSQPPEQWIAKSANMPEKYTTVLDLALSPGGNVFTAKTEKGLTIIDRDTLQELATYPAALTYEWDAHGQLKVVDDKGYLVTLQPDMAGLQVRQAARQVTAIMAGLQIADPFATTLHAPQVPVSADKTELLRSFEGLRDKITTDLAVYIANVTTLDQAQQVRTISFAQVISNLRKNTADSDVVNFVMADSENALYLKEKEIAQREGATLLVSVQSALSAPLSLTTLGEIHTNMARLDVMRDLLEGADRTQISDLHTIINQRAGELYHQEKDVIQREVEGIVDRAKTEMSQLQTLQQVGDWIDLVLPQYKARLGRLSNDCPIEVSEVRTSILQARSEIQSLSEATEDKFKKEYAKIREKAAQSIDMTRNMIQGDIQNFADRVRSNTFASRAEVEAYLERNTTRQSISEEITMLSRQDPDGAKELDRVLKSTLANLLGEVERRLSGKVAETGQQMVSLGNMQFPRWEHRVVVQQQPKVDISFEVNRASLLGPGVRAEHVMGDIVVMTSDNQGHRQTERLWETVDHEDEWRFGNAIKLMPASYVSKAEFDGISRNYRDWQREGDSTIHQAFDEAKAELDAINEKLTVRYQELGLGPVRGMPLAERLERKGRKRELDQNDEVLRGIKTEQRAALEKLQGVYSRNNIGLLRRFDERKKQPVPESESLAGLVPEWQGHWVIDAHTERYLEQMGEELKMQLDTHEGLLNLKGHAGTGKDVLVKMFCNRTNRPYFPMDCSKWTTEFELSEDVVLEAVDGATQTVKVPSTVLRAISTPGAVMYFNEFNAMPEQAQIFLHGLFDEKRSLVLKTSSGKVIKADPTVLFMSSMNPNYPGTFMPQFATKSRMVNLEIGYPPLQVDPKPDDPNRHKVYDPSEALRVAREVDSLSDLTFENNLERNEFVLLWDSYVNGINNGSPAPTAVQRFDLDVLIALTQFGSTLRENFINQTEGSGDQKRKAWRVTQPLTGREMRRCAYQLNQMPLEEKTGEAEEVARRLLARYFLSHIDKREDREDVESKMKTLASTRRPSR